MVNRLLNNKQMPYVILFLTALAIYLLNFPHILLQPNSVLSNNNEDALKNYYTFVYHIRHDHNPLHFSGMGYPYGEHAVYTDCQPVIAFVLHFLPFTHDYLVGILHWLIFLSFMITPLLLYRLFMITGTGRFVSFFSALAVSLLSPQFHKLNLGHYALAYTFVIPLSILLIVRHFQKPSYRSVAWLLIYNFLLFLLHPYIGFSVSLFSFLSLFFRSFSIHSNSKPRLWANAVLSGIVPIILFKLFMLISDKHPQRASEPFGLGNWNSGIGGLFIPDFGPFRPLLLKIFRTPPDNFEAPAYVGIFMIALLALFLILLPFIRKNLRYGQGEASLFGASLLLLAFSFGIHQKIMDLTGISVPALNQFRATGRFTWFFYYMLPLVIVPALSRQVKSPVFVKLAALCFFGLNLTEAISYFRLDDKDHWHYRNIFNKELLSAEEKKNIDLIRSKHTQAIFPLRYFHGGSEMYERPGIYSSMPPSVFYSYHTGLPTCGLFLSRSSIPETEALINLLNPYKKNRAAVSRLSGKPFTVIRDNLDLFPDEKRIEEKVQYAASQDSVKIGFISAPDLITEKRSATVRTIPYGVRDQPLEGIVFIPFDQRKPFLPASMINEERFYVLDSNLVESGDYVVSLHFKYTEKTYKAIGLNLIVTRTKGNEYEWQYNPSMRALSGFYSGTGVLEYRIRIDRHCKYEFLLKGFYDRPYTISDFMLRPEYTTVISHDGRRKIINNFPETD